MELLLPCESDVNALKPFERKGKCVNGHLEGVLQSHHNDFTALQPPSLYKFTGLW